MMLVRCRVGPSRIAGLGLFATEPIAVGSEVWRLDPGLDRTFPVDFPAQLPAAQREFLDRYAYLDATLDAWVLCGDDARFMNHSSEPNVSEVRNNRCVALRPIAPDEELTCDYHLLDSRPMRFTPDA